MCVGGWGGGVIVKTKAFIGFIIRDNLCHVSKILRFKKSPATAKIISGNSSLEEYFES